MSFSLFISEKLEEQKIKDIIKETFDAPVYDSKNLESAKGKYVFVNIENYKSGFPIGIVISWPKQLQVPISELEVAKLISKRSGTDTAFSVPKGYEGSDNPYCWWIATPDGSVYRANEDMAFINDEGLILNKEISKVY